MRDPIMTGTLSVTITDNIIKLLRDETGATAIEYALIAAAMGLALVPALSSLSGGINNLYNSIGNSVNNPVVNV